MNKDWRVGHTGRDMMYYEERHGGEWWRIGIDGEMLTGRAHHVIYFANADTWQRYPEWARHRRDEIIARIKSQFREPDYEYSEGGNAPSPTGQPTPLAKPVLPSNDGTILPMLGFLVLIAAACLWMAARGVERGEIRLPVKHASSNSMVSRAEKPGLFWAGVGVVSALGMACAAGSVWLVLVRLRDLNRLRQKK